MRFVYFERNEKYLFRRKKKLRNEKEGKTIKMKQRILILSKYENNNNNIEW